MKGLEESAVTEVENSVVPVQFKAPAAAEWRVVQTSDSDAEQQQKATAARDALKEALLSSLQMQHVVILAGSGTSLGPVGGPSMRDLWDAAIGTPPRVEATDTAQKIHYDLQTQSRNIEEFLSRTESYLQVVADEEVKTFVNSCKSVILERCSGFLKIEKLEGHKTFLHRLSRRRVRDPRLKLFTTNYDLCFEHAASALGGVVIDGFSFTPPRHYDPRYFGYDIIRRPRASDDQGNYLEGVFLLYKLHGSVNWARSADGLIRETPKPSPEEACLIYPARGKFQQSFLQPYLESLSQYLTALREPNTCVIAIGMGFNDDHLSEPLLAAVRSNPHLRLVIADPGVMAREREGDGANRYWQEFFGLAASGEDIWFVNSSFQEFATLVPDLKSLSPADRLVKTIQSVAEKK